MGPSETVQVEADHHVGLITGIDPICQREIEPDPIHQPPAHAGRPDDLYPVSKEFQRLRKTGDPSGGSRPPVRDAMPGVQKREPKRTVHGPIVVTGSIGVAVTPPERTQWNQWRTGSIQARAVWNSLDCRSHAKHLVCRGGGSPGMGGGWARECEQGGQGPTRSAGPWPVERVRPVSDYGAVRIWKPSPRAGLM